MERITVEQALAMTKQGEVALIDVRTPAEFRGVHVAGAVNVPLDELTVDAVLARSGGKKRVAIICHTGGRSTKACELIANDPRLEILNVEGGTQRAIDAGLPVVREQCAVISLDRQVRIVAGSLIVIGCALGALVAPTWYALAAFVGAGLVFAGVTNTCGMARVLGKMPWNR